MNGMRGWWSVIWGLCLVAATASPAQEVEREFRSARQSLGQKMKDRSPETRLAAVSKLAEFPILDAAKILLLQGLASDHEDVRHASFVALGKFKENREICQYLQVQANLDLKKGTPELATSAALGVLLGSDLVAVRKDAQQLLDRAAASPAGPMILVTLVDELGFQSDDASLRTLHKLAELPLVQRQFGPRRAYVQALIRMRRTEAVTELVEMLPGLHGEVKAEIQRHLATLAGQWFETDDQWQTWWQKQQGSFQFPAAGQKPEGAAIKGVPTYYGLPLYGAKILFVIDTSSSMSGGRIVAAQRELMKAIGELPDGVEFNVLAFNTVVIPWRDQLVASSGENKQAALQFVLALQLGAKTHSYDALEAALTFDAESIYFLTDGIPTGGKIIQPALIVSTISQTNRVRRMTINTIGIGVGPAGSPFDQFLAAIARQDFGVYRRVDE